MRASFFLTFRLLVSPSQAAVSPEAAEVTHGLGAAMSKGRSVLTLPIGTFPLSLSKSLLPWASYSFHQSALTPCSPLYP